MSNEVFNRTDLFPTPVWWGILDDYEDLNNKLLEYILKLKKQNITGASRSNNLGWHSPDFNLGDDVPKIFLEKSKPLIKKAIDDMEWDLNIMTSRITNMWSIINPQNTSNHRHIHPNCFLSSAYYIRAHENCGELILHDPRSAAVYKTANLNKINEINNQVYNIIPREGMLVLFPSYLHHSVSNNNSNEERVVLSFNVDLIPNQG